MEHTHTQKNTHIHTHTHTHTHKHRSASTLHISHTAHAYAYDHTELTAQADQAGAMTYRTTQKLRYGVPELWITEVAQATHVSEFVSPPGSRLRVYNSECGGESPWTNLRLRPLSSPSSHFFDILDYLLSRSRGFSHRLYHSVHPTVRVLCPPFSFLPVLDVPSRIWSPSLKSMCPTRLTMIPFPS
ncbi:hypothetical protein LX32DRAFT_81924 [Colletotrichum zoysiae]|uniref:Uncharacterized protein n=1 Tax=Colletotrichum zoysiae TaxID=1216348 RepID=A0AAD9H9Z0_9PEZI|nr:hypothetical protein LX32DRAFT_81924 [Colletotrichum zoysiae]